MATTCSAAEGYLDSYLFSVTHPKWSSVGTGDAEGFSSSVGSLVTVSWVAR